MDADDLHRSAQTNTIALDSQGHVGSMRSNLAVQENLPIGFLAGLVAALACAGIWAVLTVVTGYQIGFMAIGVGFAVGYAVRLFGKGNSSIYGMIGAGLSLFGCVLGNLLMVSYFVGIQGGIPFMQVLSSLSPTGIVDLLVATFDVMDILFYGIALYYGYTLSISHSTDEESASET